MIGVAISTCNRRDLLLNTHHHWRKNSPPGTPIVIVDDHSTSPISPLHPDTHIIRNDRRLGIAMTKNRGIKALTDLGVTDLFLADDDIHPTTPDWWAGYVNSPEPHLSYQWVKPSPPSNPWMVKHYDGRHWSITNPRGVMLYADRTVIDTVGGMDPAYGGWGGEHIEWSDRIHRAGLTRWPYADLVGSDRLWYAHDRYQNTTNSTVPLRDRVALAQANRPLATKQRDTVFVPYREHATCQDYQLGPRLASTPLGLLRHVVNQIRNSASGVALEFGVGAGRSLKVITERIPAIGFDSFQGLPEKWRDGFDAGMFACEPPRVHGATLVHGLYGDTLPTYRWPEHVSLVHIDCDLYSSTKTVLEHVGPHLKPGTYVVFDEYHGYGESASEHEQRAWREFAAATGIGWTVLGCGPEQWAIRII